MPDRHTDTAAVPVPDAGDDTLRDALVDTVSPWTGPGRTAGELADALLPLIREHVEQVRRDERDERLLSVILGTPADGPHPFVLLADDDKPFAYGVQWPGGVVTVKPTDPERLGNLTCASLDDYFTEHGTSRVMWLAEDLGTLADAQDAILRARAVCDAVKYKVPGESETYGPYAEGRFDLASQVEAAFDGSETP